MRQIGLFFRLSYRVKPDPEHELCVLEDVCASFGRAVILLTRDVSSLRPGALVAFGADGEHNGLVLATGRFVEFIDVRSGAGREWLRKHPLYQAERPDNAAGFVMLEDVELNPAATLLDQLEAWSEAGQRLSAATLPEGPGGVSIYFVTGPKPPTEEETRILVRARMKEAAEKAKRRGTPMETSPPLGGAELSPELVAILAEQLNAASQPRGRRRMQARSLAALLRELAPRVRLVGHSAAACMDFEEIGIAAVGVILRMLQAGAPPSESGHFVKDVAGQRGWLECHIGNTTGRLYFKPLPQLGEVLVLISNKARQVFDIPRLASYG
jgi:hypothetical protein